MKLETRSASVFRRFIAIIFIVTWFTPQTSAQGLGYYWQSITGHLAVLNAARPVREWVADPATPAPLKARLELAQRIRSFAVAELHLQGGASYQRYADIKRSSVVWNVVAAPPDSLTLKTFCFPIAGCAGYKGYYAEADARAEAARLQAEGLEVSVYGVPAYSTLGYLNWAGGDPLLSTFINYPEGELARMLFHEMAHQVAFASGDTMFNESFATAVERLGSQRWLSAHASEPARAEYARYDERRNQFRALTLLTRRNLEQIYRSASVNGRFAATKSGAMNDFKRDYEALKATWGGYAGYDAWVARANNASFGALASYDELVPAFEALFEKEGGDWLRFYAEVKRLAALPAGERRGALVGR